MIFEKLKDVTFLMKFSLWKYVFVISLKMCFKVFCELILLKINMSGYFS